MAEERRPGETGPSEPPRYMFPAPGTTDQSQPSWLNTMPPMSGVQEHNVGNLHPVYWEAQQVAARRGNLQWGIMAFVIGYLFFHLAGLIIGALTHDSFEQFDPAQPPILGPLLLLSFAPNVLLGLVPAIASWWKGSGLRSDYGIVPTGRDFRVGLACGGLSLAAAFVINLAVFSLVDIPESPVGDIASGATEKTIWLGLFALFLFLGAPLTEELLTRGALWGALEHYKVPRYAILALTALVFALMHLEPHRVVALFVQGMIVGYARMLTGRISASIIAHAVNNLLPALVIFFGVGAIPGS